jgi:hypothetical protein
MKNATTKKARTKRRASEMRAEYDFSTGVRGVYADAYRRKTNVILLDRDLAAVFPDSESVNDALRALVTIADRAKAPKHRLVRG